ncbi:hypothetical protein AKJ09_07320 [Labilithrix luteola]|uniref:Uncharacterized protein n=1 Tax=Labilithrix luteola TaxID=1391654 RepID=A0A0K1Q4Q9_9BACT|nr:hypothetical protein [Labilithrix luteola]AKV00657.1 hypothetical protein AKJ09_07320 [Labilithrix luteola]
MTEHVRSMEPTAAATVLQRALKDPTKPMTVADAQVVSGLSQRDTEAGLNWLTSEYRGHLRVTEEGDLVHLFPTGFTKPWETRETLAKIGTSIGRGLLGAGRFLVRAWLLVVMVSYALLFVALLVGLTFARQSNDRDDHSPALSIAGGLFRMIGDALFWTFHPFSPLYVGHGYGYGYGYGYRDEREWRDPRRRGRRDEQPDVPFYEKVNRFVFGPTKPPEDPHAMRARILESIRANKGRIGLADVMRVTGLPRHEADPLMAKLMLDHDGTVEVSEEGGIYYRFEGLRRTAGEAQAVMPPPAWATPPKLAPLTGNSGAANLGIALLNGFNLFASGWVMANGLTIANIQLLFSRHPPLVLPNDGLPLALGLVPFLFSLGLFVLPAVRAALRGRTEKKVAEENARLAILREVLARAPKGEPVTDETLRTVYRVATGHEPTSKEITARVVDLGGDVDVGPEGEVRYRFADLEAEAEALEEERAQASEAEARLGKVVFASDR